MNLPCLLDDKMKPRADLHPIRLTVDRSLQPLSMAEMVLPPEDAPVCVRDFVRLCDGFGDDEIYRVSSISEEPGLRRVVQLEHGMATLADDMLPALTYAENVQTILKRILSYQTRIRWRVARASSTISTCTTTRRVPTSRSATTIRPRPPRCGCAR